MSQNKSKMLQRNHNRDVTYTNLTIDIMKGVFLEQEDSFALGLYLDSPIMPLKE